LLSTPNPEYRLYFSADHPLVSDVSIYDLAEAAFMQGFEGIFIDEIHYAKDWGQQLKSIYDSFPGKQIWATDSSAIVLRKGMADISRRFLVRRLPLLSFREFMILQGIAPDFPVLDPFELDQKQVLQIAKKHNILKSFEEYLSHGFRPFFLEGVNSYPEKLLNVLEKAMTMDIPFLVPQISQNHLRFMSAVVGYLTQASVPTLAVNSLCNEWGLSKEKLYQLIGAMEEAQILRIIRKKKDHKLHSIGAKIFLHEPAAYSALGGDLGTLREAYCAAALQESGRTVTAAIDDREYDFLIDGKISIEVGGRGKSSKSAQFVIRDRTDFPSGNGIPMWVLGMMY